MYKKAFITGATSGIGLEIFKKLLVENYEIHYTFRENPIDTIDDRCVGYKTGDVSLLDESFFRKFDEIEFNVIINNVGMNIIEDIKNLNIENLTKVMNTNFVFPFMCLKNLNISDHGKVVNISSISGITAKAGRLSYSASKHAMNALTSTAALELASRNVLVNSVCPGPIETKMTLNSVTSVEEFVSKIPLGRLGTVEEVANLVLFLISDKNSYITGQNIIIDGGLTCGW